MYKMYKPKLAGVPACDLEKVKLNINGELINFNISYYNLLNDYFKDLQVHNVIHTYHSGLRKNIYDYTPDISFYIDNNYLLSLNCQNFLKQCVNEGFVFMASTATEKIETKLVLFIFVEFSDGNTQYLLDGYVKTLEDFKTDSMKKLWKTMFNQNSIKTIELEEMNTKVEVILNTNIKTIDLEETVEVNLDIKIKPEDQIGRIKICKTPYHPNYFNIFVIMDLDKTSYLSKNDVTKLEDKKFFIDEYEVFGKTAISNEYFRYKMMIRPGMYWAIRRLQRISQLHLMTAGDIHFARQAVIEANKKKWISTNDITTDNEKSLEDVHIPLANLVSCRDRIKLAAPKIFERSLPFAVFMKEYGLTSENLPILCIDDSINAWDTSIQKNVIPISVFQPLNNSHEDILKIVEKIEKCAQLYFNQLIYELFKDYDTSIIELNIDFQTFVNALKKINIVDIFNTL